MDGVLADFFGAFSSYCGVSHWKELEHEELMQKIDSIKGTDFFAKIPKTWCCDELIDLHQIFLGVTQSCLLLSTTMKTTVRIGKECGLSKSL